jgi:hypothetical protein
VVAHRPEEPKPVSEFDAASAARRSPQQPDLEGIDTNTGPMWAIALLPLASVVIGLIPGSFNGFAPDPTPTGVVLNVLTVVLQLGLVVVGLLLAVEDRRILRRRGMFRPMHPAWDLIEIVYVIGRAVVVHRRVRGSLHPLWVWIGTTVVASVLNSLPR